MHPNEKLIRDFYAAFARRDDKTMAAAYAADATFQDPVFGDLRGARIGAMWRMLCERGAGLRCELSNVSAIDIAGSSRLDAWYTFSATGRPVHNVLDSNFTFANGKITEHIDHFDLYRWSRQALGAKGILLGWTPFVQGAIRKQAAGSLAAFMKKNGIT